MASNLRGAFFASVPTFNQLVPNEGPKSMGFNMSMDENEHVIDLKEAQSRDVIDAIQTIYFDMSECTVDVVLVVQTTGQRMTFKPDTQGYRPVLAGEECRLVFSGAGASSDIFRCNLLNVPMPHGEWSVA